MCQALGRKPLRWSLSIGPVRLAARFVEDMAHLVGSRPNLRARIDKYTEDVAVDGHRFQNELGFVSQYNLSAGWRETAREMRRSGDL